MKKLISLVMASLLILGFAGYSFGAGNYGLDNAEIVGAFGGASGISPATQIVKVRYARSHGAGMNYPSLSSGDIVTWDLISSDGVTISLCTASNDPAFAGVLVTDILTAESTSVNPSDRNWGYMAVKGYCLARVVTQSAGTGGHLYTLSGVDGNRGLGTTTSATYATGSVPVNSSDIGILLRDTGTTGLMPVILK